MTVLFWMLVFFFFPIILPTALLFFTLACSMVVCVGWCACAIIGVLADRVKRWRY